MNISDSTIAEMEALAAYDEERYQIEKKASALDKYVISERSVKLLLFQYLYNQLSVDSKAELYDKLLSMLGNA